MNKTQRMRTLQRERLIEAMEESSRKYQSDLQKMRLPKWERLVRYPAFTIGNYFLRKVLYEPLARAGVKLKAKTFFDEKIVVPFGPYFAVWRYGANTFYDAEMRLAKFIIRNVEDGAVFFDVGAHCGFYSLLVHKVSEGARIFAFEPDPSILKTLEKNRRENIQVIPKAVSEENGTTKLYSSPSSCATLSTLNPNVFREAGVVMKDYQEMRIETTSIDSVCTSLDVHPSFLKIDVEGSEEKVLRGARELLKSHSPTIAMEVWIRPFTENHRKAMEILRESGFLAHRIKESGETEIIEPENLEDYFSLVVRRHSESEGKIPLDNMIFQK